ncbi:unnamed protein product [Cylicocyclus nassatus]|uniref:Uncharacterized protein n=1 Tax=Cylicocyclus nassatus TaxID=53992 RepID=A0AA36M8X6_CYLNA|nr:unnamed protein product [Cylicocyclus nassatus]
MDNPKVQSHLLFGLFTTQKRSASTNCCKLAEIVYIMIEVNLLCSDLYDLTPNTNKSDGTDNTSMDIEAFKVILSMAMHAICILCFVVCLMASNVAVCMKLLPPIVILTVLIFNIIFNIAGALPLWLHKAPYCRGGFSHSIRGSAVMSTVALAYNVGLAILYCASPSIRRRSSRERYLLKDEKAELEKNKAGKKEVKPKKGSKQASEDVEKPAESSDLQESHDQIKPSGVDLKKPAPSPDSQDTREQNKASESNVKKSTGSSDLQESRDQNKPSDANVKKLTASSDVQESREQNKRSSKSSRQKKSAGEQGGAETDELPQKKSKDKRNSKSPTQKKGAGEQEGAEDEIPAKESKDKEHKVVKAAQVKTKANLRAIGMKNIISIEKILYTSCK